MSVTNQAIFITTVVEMSSKNQRGNDAPEGSDAEGLCDGQAHDNLWSPVLFLHHSSTLCSTPTGALGRAHLNCKACKAISISASDWLKLVPGDVTCVL
ncbi:unnamed protein product [Arctogadus glacialis]